jgi:hypothetical protein
MLNNSYDISDHHIKFNKFTIAQLENISLYLVITIQRLVKNTNLLKIIIYGRLRTK